MALRQAIAGLLLLSPGAAWAQGALLQGGQPVNGQAPMYSGAGSQAVVQASGAANGSGTNGGGPGVGLTEFLQVNRVAGTGPYGTHACLYDHPTTTPTGYHYFCLDAGTGNRALMAVGNGGSAAPLPFQFCINGTCYDFPFVTGGIVGPGTTTIGHVATWANTQGTLLGDLGGGLALTGELTVDPPASSLTQGIVLNQSTAGSSPSPFYANYLQVSPDAVDTGSEFRQALGIIDRYGYGVNGGTQSLAVFSFLQSPSAGGNTNRNYVAINALAAAQSGDTGTGGGSQINWKGAIFGISPWGMACGTTVRTGICPTGIPATNLLEVTGGEVNVSLEPGSSAWYKGGWTIAALPQDTEHGHQWDCELCLSNQPGAVGWTDAILIGPMNGQYPLTAGIGTLIRSNLGSYVNGIDLSTDTISGNAWLSPGAAITGAGAASFTTGQFTGAVLTGPLIATGNSGVVGNFNVTGSATVAALTSTGAIAGTSLSGSGLAVTGNIAAGGGISGVGITSTGNLAGVNLGISGTAGITGLLTLGGQLTIPAMASSSGGFCVGITGAGQLYISGVSC